MIQTAIFSICFDHPAAILKFVSLFFLLAIFLSGTLDNREDVNKQCNNKTVKNQHKQARQEPSRQPFCVCFGSDRLQSFWLVEMFGLPSGWLKQIGPYQYWWLSSNRVIIIRKKTFFLQKNVNIVSHIFRN